MPGAAFFRGRDLPLDASREPRQKELKDFGPFDLTLLCGRVSLLPYLWVFAGAMQATHTEPLEMEKGRAHR